MIFKKELTVFFGELVITGDLSLPHYVYILMQDLSGGKTFPK